MSANAIHRIGFVSDLHLLSKTGLVPPEWRVPRDPLAPVQKYLWDCWRHFVNSCPPLDVLIVVGDLIEGRTPTQRDLKGAISDDATDQIEALVDDALGPLAKKAKSLYCVRGTRFHEEGDQVEAAARALGAVRWADGGRRYSGHVLDLECFGVKVNASHHNTRGWLWLAGAASRMAVFAAAAEATTKMNRADLIVRGDLHSYVGAQVAGKHVVFLPGWTMPNIYAIKRMEAIRAHLATDIGAVVATVSIDGIAVRPYLYPLFRYQAVRL